jgi:hypothetical protein
MLALSSFNSLWALIYCISAEQDWQVSYREQRGNTATTSEKLRKVEETSTSSAESRAIFEIVIGLAEPGVAQEFLRDRFFKKVENSCRMKIYF